MIIPAIGTVDKIQNKNIEQVWKNIHEFILESGDPARNTPQKLELEKYRSGGRLTHAEHFVARAITLMTHHFEQIIQNTIRVQNITIVQDLSGELSTTGGYHGAKLIHTQQE